MDGLTFHHVFEWNKGHYHDEWNIMPLCPDCHKLITPNRFKFPAFKPSVVDQVVEILKSSQPEKTKILKLKHWVSQRHMPKRDINRVLTYLMKVEESEKHVLTLSHYKKHTGEVILKWDVNLAEA